MNFLKFLLITLMMLPSWTYANNEDRPNKALCPVCAALGETEKEKVKAHAEHDGQAYYFCSKNCLKEFEKDPTAYIPPRLPRPVPSVSVETLEGKRVRLDAYEGKVIVLDFWATWCKPCVDLMPGLESLSKTYGDKGLVVLGVSVDEGKDHNKQIRKFVDKVGVSYPIFLDARSPRLWHTFKVKAIPALFLIDRSGQIVAQWLGKIDHKALETEIRKHLK
ncbi:MAG: redoxin domain-containing protein [Candidatus Latescibacterota bacterium]|nr:redoxin domain-containing protein [Candidatus Latescibacterota bacterium]